MAEEKKLENRIKKWLTEKGCYWVKYFGCAYTRSGVADLLCCIKGKFVALECKSSVGRLSELQKHEIEKVQKSGGLAYCVSPKNWEEVKQDIEKIIGEEK